MAAGSSRGSKRDRPLDQREGAAQPEQHACGRPRASVEHARGVAVGGSAASEGRGQGNAATRCVVCGTRRSCGLVRVRHGLCLRRRRRGLVRPKHASTESSLPAQLRPATSAGGGSQARAARRCRCGGCCCCPKRSSCRSGTLLHLHHLLFHPLRPLCTLFNRSIHLH